MIKGHENTVDGPGDLREQMLRHLAEVTQLVKDHRVAHLTITYGVEDRGGIDNYGLYFASGKFRALAADCLQTLAGFMMKTLPAWCMFPVQLSRVRYAPGSDKAETLH